MKLANGFVTGRVLRFHKCSIDGSGKCDIRASPNTADAVYGVVYEIPENEIAQLRDAEGVGKGYHEESVSVVLVDGGVLQAKAFVADETYLNPQLKPYTWYKGLVVAGAEQNGLTSDYVAAIRAAPAERDREINRRGKREAEAVLRKYRRNRPA